MSLEKLGVQLRDQAVLCRSNKRLNEIASALEERGIAVLHLGSLFEREEIRDLLALLSLAVDRFGDGLTRVGAMPRYGLSLQDVYVVTRHLRAGDADQKSYWMSLSRSCKRSRGFVTPEGVEAGLALLAQPISRGYPISISAWEFLSSIIFWIALGLVR